MLESIKMLEYRLDLFPAKFYRNCGLKAPAFRRGDEKTCLAGTLHHRLC